MPEGKYFFIRSKLNGLVVDIAGHQCEAGREIVLEEKRDVDNDTQIWYEEQFTGTIRSKLHDFCLTVNGMCIHAERTSHAVYNECIKCQSVRDSTCRGITNT